MGTYLPRRKKEEQVHGPKEDLVGYLREVWKPRALMFELKSQREEGRLRKGWGRTWNFF